MVTYFLSDKDVRAYLRDFLSRLERLDPVPTVWCPVTLSGSMMLKQMLPIVKMHHPGLARNVSVVPVEVDANKAVDFKLGSREDIAGKPVLLFDSSLHTGGTMRRSVAEAIRLGASEVATYSLVIKRGSCFVPTFWGVMIDDTDRIYFLLEKIPNGRLDAGPEHDKSGNDRKIRCVHIERLNEEHIKAKPVNCGVQALDRVTWGDRYFDMHAGEHEQCTYVLLAGSEIVGYLSVHFSDPTCLFITEIAVSQACKNKGYGSILMRFADTLARQYNCLTVRLNAIEDRIKYYQGFDYILTGGRQPIALDDKKYHPMEHKVVYLPIKFTA